jgi:hypothetical protein
VLGDEAASLYRRPHVGMTSSQQTEERLVHARAYTHLRQERRRSAHL